MLKNLFILGLSLANSVFAKKEVNGPADDLVESLPGFSLEQPLFSGYLVATKTKWLHYMFVESASETQETDPVLIWFNGGPGCSSLLGFFQENGPIVLSDNGMKSMNDWSWNRKANVLYIESPAGVGYSLAGEDEDWNHNDMSQSQDAFAALKHFYEKFPKYAKNELWISGESYAGIYVPYLAW